MKPLLAIEQDPTLPGLGLLGRSVRARGVPIVSVHAWEGDLDGLRPADFGGIVPLGGSMQSWDETALPYLGRQRRFLREAVEEGVPVLGICLGGQLLARALGAEVRPAERLEAGWLAIEATPEAADDALLGHLRDPVSVYVWHSDIFDLPEGSVRLARSEQSENQAFRYGERWWGVQSPHRGGRTAVRGLDAELRACACRGRHRPAGPSRARSPPAPRVHGHALRRVLLGLPRRRLSAASLRCAGRAPASRDLDSRSSGGGCRRRAGARAPGVRRRAQGQ